MKSSARSAKIREKDKERSVERFERFPALKPDSKQLGPFPAKVYAMTSTVVFFKFNIFDQEQVACAIPGRLYVNGSENLLKFGKSKDSLAAIFDPDMDFKIVVRELAESRRAFLNTVALDPAVTEKEKAEDRPSNVAYYVNLLCPFGYNEKLIQKGLSIQQKFHIEDHSFKKYLDQVHSGLFGGRMENVSLEQVWFMLSDMGLTHITMKEGTLAPTRLMLRGWIKELMLPFGGIIELEGTQERVTFYRMNLYVEGKRVGFTDTLENVIKVGDKVLVDAAANMKQDGGLFMSGVEGASIATSVYKGNKLPEDEHIKTPPKLVGDESHKVNVFELNLDPAGTGAYISGVAVVQMSALIHKDKASASMIGEFVKFQNKDLWYCGVNLAGVDLSYLFRPGDTFYASLIMLPVKEGRCQYAVQHGFHGRLDLSPFPLPESSVVYKTMITRNMDFQTFENVLMKKVKPRQKTVEDGTAIGRLNHLEPADNKETVSRGTVLIEAGPHKGKIVKMSRSKLSVMGISLDNCDLLYCLNQGEIMYVEVGGICDYPEGQYVAQFVRLISPHKTEFSGNTDENPMLMPQDHRIDFLAWLHHRKMTYQLFMQVKAQAAPFKYFIPFPKDNQLGGRVISLDPIRSKYGAAAGTILIDNGLMTVENPAVGQLGVKQMMGVKVTFHRTNFWVYGRKMAKADLTYLIKPGQRIMLECAEITDQEREHYPNLPANIQFRATIVWVGSSRPRNDKDDPNRNDVGIFDWLSKRGLNINQFNKLVDGSMPPHSPMDLDHRNFFLPPEKGATSMDDIGMPEAMPVLRHGPQLAHILDTAMSSTGPKDPRLFHLLENDSEAQAAHHVAEALKTAIGYYREKKSHGRGGGCGGYGPRGPPPGGAPKRGGAPSAGRGGPNKRARGGFGFR